MKEEILFEDLEWFRSLKTLSESRLVSGVSGKTKSFQKDKHYKKFIFTRHGWHPHRL